MIKALGLILVCSSPSAESCQILTSPTVFESRDECLASTLDYSLFIIEEYSPAFIRPMCTDLKPAGIDM